MKTKLLFVKVLLLMAGYSLSAQVIPNSGFETWSGGATNPPDGWEDHGSNHPGFYASEQTTVKYLGNYAVKLENKITATDTTEGVISTIRPNSTGGFGPAFPITARHNNLKGYYKYAPLNGDSAEIVVYITKSGFVNTQGWGDLLAWGQEKLGAAATYAPFSVGYKDSLPDFVYFDNVVVPDSAYIEIAAYKFLGTVPGDQPKPLGNSVLYVDALNFDSFLSGVNEHLDITSNFKLYPSISEGDFNVAFETSKSDYTTIKVYDLSGREVADLFSGSLGSGSHFYHYDLRSLDNGMYMFMISTAEGYKVEKCQIQK